MSRAENCRFDVLGIGNAIVDVLAHVDDEFLIRHDLVKGAMRLIDEVEAHELYESLGPTLEMSGGSAANTIAGLASFGRRAAFIGKVHADQLGEVFAHDIRSLGVHFDTPPAKDGPSTARCLVLVTPDGERTMNTWLGAAQNLGPEDVDEALVRDSAIVYLEGYLWDPPHAKEAFRKAADIAREAGRKVALSLSDSFCVDRHRESFLELIENRVDILFANEAEIKSLYQVPYFNDAMHAVKAHCPLAVLTRSAAGSVIVEGDDIHVIEAHPVKRVVDATGAGDLFAAGFLAGYAEGRPVAECARLGALAAAEIIQQLGARAVRPFREVARENGF
jgi:sugar/nucleoside kinase (ribokinase family)